MNIMLNVYHWDLNIEFQMLVALCVITKSSDQGVGDYNVYMCLNWRAGVLIFIKFTNFSEFP